MLHPVPGSSHAREETTTHNRRVILMSISSGIDLPYQPSHRPGWKIMSSSFVSLFFSFSVTLHRSTVPPPFAILSFMSLFALPFHSCLYVSDERPRILLSSTAKVKVSFHLPWKTPSSLQFPMLAPCFQPKHPLLLASYTLGLGEQNNLATFPVIAHLIAWLTLFPWDLL